MVNIRAWQAAYAHAFGAERLSAMDLEAQRELWRQRLAQPRRGDVVLVAEADGSVVGFASCGNSLDASGEGELYSIYVLPEAWGTGAGSALMAGALEALRGYPSATLWVLEDNPRAQRFYEREGWTRDGGRREEEFLGVTITEIGYRITLG